MLSRVNPRRTIWTIWRASYRSPGAEQIIQVGRPHQLGPSGQPGEDPAESFQAATAVNGSGALLTCVVRDDLEAQPSAWPLSTAGWLEVT